MKYQTYKLIANFGGAYKWFEITAVSLDAAKADVFCAYGEFELIQWGTK